MVIHRITGDGPKDLLIAPDWNTHKKWVLNDIEKDIILKHMWPVTFSTPHYLETFVVTFVDKYCAIKEWSNHCKYSVWSWYFNWFYI